MMKNRRTPAHTGSARPIVMAIVLIIIAVVAGAVWFEGRLPSIAFFEKILTIDQKDFEFMDTDGNSMYDGVKVPISNQTGEPAWVRSVVVSTSTDGVSWYNVNSSRISVPFTVPEGQITVKAFSFTPVFFQFISPGEVSYRLQVTYRFDDGEFQVLNSPVVKKIHGGLDACLEIKTEFYSKTSIGGHVVDRGARDSAPQRGVANVIKLTISNHWIGDLQIFDDFGSFSPAWCAGLWVDDLTFDGIQDYRNQIYGLVIRDEDFSQAWACKSRAMLGTNYDTGAAKMWSKMLGQTEPATIAGVDNDRAQTIKKGETAVFHFIALARNPEWGALIEGRQAYFALAFHDYMQWGAYFLHHWAAMVDLIQ